MGLPSKAWPIDRTGRVLITEAGAVEVDTAAITVGTTAVLLEVSGGPKRRELFIRNFETPENVVYIGGDSGVTTSTGFPLYRNDEIELDVSNDADVYAIAESSDGEVRIMEVE